MTMSTQRIPPTIPINKRSMAQTQPATTTKRRIGLVTRIPSTQVWSLLSAPLFPYGDDQAVWIDVLSNAGPEDILRRLQTLHTICDHLLVELV